MHENYTSFVTFDNTRLQGVADFVVNKVKPHISSRVENDKLSCQYLGGQVISLPKWFLYTQGHGLETNLKNAFQELKRFQKESQLKLEIIAKVIDDVPSLIPYDFVCLLK